jgi:hypothetical protein
MLLGVTCAEDRMSGSGSALVVVAAGGDADLVIETLHTSRCSSVIRRDQYPWKPCLSGSGFPMPSLPLRWISAIKVLIA